MQQNSYGNPFDNRSENYQNRTDPETVQVLSPEERENFNGITIEQENGKTQNTKTGSPFQKVFVFQSAGGPLSKLIVSALLIIAVVVFLPLAILFIATIGLNWLSNRSKE